MEIYDYNYLTISSLIKSFCDLIILIFYCYYTLSQYISYDKENNDNDDYNLSFYLNCLLLICLLVSFSLKIHYYFSCLKKDNKTNMKFNRKSMFKNIFFSFCGFLEIYNVILLLIVSEIDVFHVLRNIDIQKVRIIGLIIGMIILSTILSIYNIYIHERNSSIKISEKNSNEQNSLWEQLETK